MAFTFNKCCDLSGAPFGELRDVGLWETEHIGHHHLG